MEPQVTIPFPPDLFEALAQRVAALLREQPPAALSRRRVSYRLATVCAPRRVFSTDEFRRS
jgi:hypothetical protein